MSCDPTGPASERAGDDGGLAVRGPVLLVAMPWEMLGMPSIQLGILSGVLARAGIEATCLSLKLPFWERCLAAGAARLEDYDRIAQGAWEVGLGEWIVAVPPFADTGATDPEYFDYLRRNRVSEDDIALARRLRALVPGFLEAAAAEVLAARPRVIGFTSSFSQNVASLVLSKIVKAREPAVRIVFGGANCEGPMGAALHRAFPWIDAVVRGEAEAVLPGLVRDLLAGGPVRALPGTCVRDEGGRSVATAGEPAVAMDDVPLPDYDEYFARLERTSFGQALHARVTLLYESARGCWWGAKSTCTFCGLNGASMAFRSKAPARVAEEILALAGRHRRTSFQIVDNIIDPKYFRDLLPRLRDAGYDLTFFWETKSNLKKHEVRLLAASGVRFMNPGIESLSSPILALMRKGVTAFQNIRLLKWCAEAGIRCHWNLIYGFPGEPTQEYARMADLVPSLAHLQSPKLTPLRLDRFSPYHERPQEHGIDIGPPLLHYRLLFPASPQDVHDLAYSFELGRRGHPDPESYGGPLRAALDAWDAGLAEGGYCSLRWRRGPGFLTVIDRRPGLEPADWVFDDVEARLYLACEDGASAAEAAAALPDAQERPEVAEVRDFLDALVAKRLVYREAGRYLALALPCEPGRGGPRGGAATAARSQRALQVAKG